MINEMQIEIFCKNPIIYTDGSYIDVSECLRNPLPDHLIATFSMTHVIKKYCEKIVSSE